MKKFDRTVDVCPKCGMYYAKVRWCPKETRHKATEDILRVACFCGFETEFLPSDAPDA